MSDSLSPAMLEQLTDRVRCRSSGRVRDLRLLVQDNGLILQGKAATYYTKQLAQQAILEADLPILANQIQVS